MWQVQQVPPERYDEGLALVVDGGHWKSLSAGVHALRNYLASLAQDSREFWWAVEGSRPLAAALLIRSPGRTGIILNSPSTLYRAAATALKDILNALADRCLGEKLILLQALLSPKATEDIRTYESAGFWRLAELIYMRQDLWSTRAPMTAPPPEVEFRSFSAQTRDDFIAAIQGSYLESLDCPKLEGLRTIDDVLAGHQASGLFRPDLWSLAYVAGRPSGVILLNEIPSERTVEIVYMGVTRESRGRGLGRMLLARAAQLAIRNGVSAVTLAVDSQNRYAMKLYQEAGFAETMRRFAYVRTIRDAQAPETSAK